MIDFLVKKFTNRRIRRNIEHGRVIPGLTVPEALEALTRTKKPNGVELFGFLSTTLKTKSGLVFPHGLQGCCLVTQAFTDYLVDALQDSANGTMDAFSYHASGTDATVESNTDTALLAEVESRTAGSQTEGASTNIYQTVGTISYSGSFNISEHGIFTASSGGTLLDRTVLGSSIDVTSGDSIEFTYELTVNAET